MREDPNYRDEREAISVFFGGKAVLTISDVSRYFQCSRKTVREKYKITDDITAVQLAKLMCRINGAH